MSKPYVPIIGLFSPLNVDLTATFNVLRALGEVRLITAGQRNLGSIDLLVYPDGMGIIPTIGGLAHSGRIFMPSKPINPYFYLFWEENPVEKFIDLEERGIPVLGIGDAAAMLYDVLGGNIVIDALGEAQLYPSKDVSIHIHKKEYDLVTAFSKDLIFGATTLGGALTLIRSITNKLKALSITEDNDSLDDNMWEPVLPPTTPQTKQDWESNP